MKEPNKEFAGYAINTLLAGNYISEQAGEKKDEIISGIALAISDMLQLLALIGRSNDVEKVTNYAKELYYYERGETPDEIVRRLEKYGNNNITY